MKIYSIEVETNLGRRVVQLEPPLEVSADPDMPRPFRSLTEKLWEILQQAASGELSASTPKAEA